MKGALAFSMFQVGLESTGGSNQFKYMKIETGFRMPDVLSVVSGPDLQAGCLWNYPVKPG